nr:hypothetical protein [Chlamydiota bacterium]
MLIVSDQLIFSKHREEELKFGVGTTPREIGGMPDHVHLLLVRQNLGKFEDDICKIKADSSRWVNKQFD